LLQQAKFTRTSTACFQESHPHVSITREAPNYSSRQ